MVQDREPNELLRADNLEEQRDFFEECVAPFFYHSLSDGLHDSPPLSTASVSR